MIPLTTTMLTHQQVHDLLNEMVEQGYVNKLVGRDQVVYMPAYGGSCLEQKYPILDEDYNVTGYDTETNKVLYNPIRQEFVNFENYCLAIMLVGDSMKAQYDNYQADMSQPEDLY